MTIPWQTTIDRCSALSASQSRFPDESFEYGQLHTFAGRVHSSPVPTIEFDTGRQALLVAPGKHGADPLVRPLDGSRVDLAADLVDGLVAGRLDDPGARELRDARSRPLVHSSGKSFLRRLFSDIKVPNKPNQGCNDAAPIGTINRVNSYVCISEHTQL